MIRGECLKHFIHTSSMKAPSLEGSSPRQEWSEDKTEYLIVELVLVRSNYACKRCWSEKL